MTALAALLALLPIVFGMLGKFPSDGVPYPVLVYVAMLPWQFFASSLAEATTRSP